MFNRLLLATVTLKGDISRVNRKRGRGLEEAAGALGFGPMVYTDPLLGPLDQIRLVHIDELRQRIRTFAGE